MSQVRLTPLSQIALRPLPPMAIDGLLPEKGIVVLQGKPGVGKSFFGLEIALAAITGFPAFERFKVKSQMRTLYLAKDSAGWDLGAQCRKLIGGRDLQVGDFYPGATFGFDITTHEGVEGSPGAHVYAEGLDFWEEPPALLATDQGANLLEQIVLDGQFNLVILDTLLAMHELPENDNGVMQQVMRRVKQVARHCTVLCLTHVGKEGETPRQGTDRTRGATAIGGGVDGILELVAVQDDQIEMRCHKQRAAKFQPFRYYMEDADDVLWMRYVDDLRDEVTPLVVKMLQQGNQTWGDLVEMLMEKDPRMPTGGSLKVKSTATRHLSHTLKLLEREGTARKIRRGLYGIVKST